MAVDATSGGVTKDMGKALGRKIKNHAKEVPLVGSGYKSGTSPNLDHTTTLGQNDLKRKSKNVGCAQEPVPGHPGTLGKKTTNEWSTENIAKLIDEDAVDVQDLFNSYARSTRKLTKEGFDELLKAHGSDVILDDRSFLTLLARNNEYCFYENNSAYVPILIEESNGDCVVCEWEEEYDEEPYPDSGHTISKREASVPKYGDDTFGDESEDEDSFEDGSPVAPAGDEHYVADDSPGVQPGVSNVDDVHYYQTSDFEEYPMDSDSDEVSEVDLPDYGPITTTSAIVTSNIPTRHMQNNADCCEPGLEDLPDGFGELNVDAGLEQADPLDERGMNHPTIEPDVDMGDDFLEADHDFASDDDEIPVPSRMESRAARQRALFETSHGMDGEGHKRVKKLDGKSTPDWSDKGKAWPRKQKNVGEPISADSKHGDASDGMTSELGSINLGGKTKNNAKKACHTIPGATLTGGVNKLNENASRLSRHLKPQVNDFRRLVGESSLTFVASVPSSDVKSLTRRSLSEAILDAEELAQAYGEGSVAFTVKAMKGNRFVESRTLSIVPLSSRGLIYSEGRALFRNPQVARQFASRLATEGKAARIGQHNWGAFVSSKVSSTLAEECFKSLNEACLTSKKKKKKKKKKF